MPSSPSDNGANKRSGLKTKKIRSENNRNVSEKRYYRLFETAAYGILILDYVTGKVLDANPYILNLFNLPLSQVLNKRMWEVSPVCDQSHFTQLKHEGYLRIDNMPLPGTNDEIIDVEIDSNVYTEDRKKIIQCSIRDITEKNRETEALRLSEARFKQVSEEISEWVWEIDPSGLYTYTNESVTQLLGYTPEEIVGKKYFYDFIDPDRKSELIEEAKDFFSDKRILKNHIRTAIRKDGHQIFLSTSALPILDRDNQLIGYHGVDIDATERMQAEQVLRQHSVILEGVSTGIMLIDPKDHTIIDVNSKAIQLISDKKENIVGKVCQKYICPAENGNCPVTDQNKKVKNKECVLVNKRGDSIPILKTVTQIEIEGKKVLLENFTDISKQKRVESEIKKSEQRFKNLFENSGVGIWEVDLSDIKKYFDHLSNQGVRNFKEYFEAHPDEVAHCSSLTLLKDANKEIVHFFKAKRKKDVLTNLLNFFTQESLESAKDVLISLAKGKSKINGEIPIKTISGEIKHVVFRLSIVRGEEKTLKKGLISFVDITSTKKAKQAVEESEKQLHQIMENVDAVFYMISIPSGELVFINSAYERIWKRPIAEVMENPEKWLEAVHEDDLAEATRIYEQGSGELQYRIVLPDGSVRWIWDKTFPILDNTGNPIYICGMATDITERKQAEVTLRESEARLDEAMNIAKLSTWEFDLLKNQFIFTDKFFNLMRTTAEKEGGYIMSPRDYAHRFIHPDDRHLLFEEQMKVLDNAEPTYSNYMEHRIFYADGQPGYLAVSIRIELGHEGIPLRIHGVSQDITERKLIEEALKERENSYRTLAENLPASVYRLHLREKGRMEFFNDVIEQISGYSKEELSIGEVCSIDPYIYSEDKKQILKSVKNAIKNNTEFEVEYRFKRKDGHLSFFYEKGKPILGEDGKPLYIDGVIFDISEAKQAEKELIEAKEKAEESDRLKSAFLANMSHEIRTPMNGILGFTSILKDRERILSDKDRLKYINIIERSGVRMLNIINDIISISKIESGQMEMYLSYTNINEQVDFIYTFFKEEADQKKIKFFHNTLLPNEKAVVKTDKEKIYAILTNLVKNALKFTKTGSIEFGYHKKGKFLEFFVKDTGTGIDKKHKDIIFERFRQGSESLSRNYEGSGLGLAISKAYAEMLGGKIWMESELGKGSTFYFTIPYNTPGKKK